MTLDLIMDEEGRVDNFIFLNDIQYKKQNILGTNPELEDQYNPIFMNNGLSQSLDTIHLANEMNIYCFTLPKKLQHDFLFYSVRKGGYRKGKWASYKKDETLKMLMKYYECSATKAKEYRRMLSKEDLNKIKEEMTIGGLIKKKLNE
jgi:hypothetical protein